MTVSIKIIVAEKVEKNGMGYSIEENVSSLTELVASLTRGDLEQASAKSAELWAHHKNLTEDYLTTTYSQLMEISL